MHVARQKIEPLYPPKSCSNKPLTDSPTNPCGNVEVLGAPGTSLIQEKELGEQDLGSKKSPLIQMPVTQSPVTEFQPAEASEEHACHISIRCSQPTADGQMQVTLEYSGDADLASLLINHAQEIIDEQTSR